MSTIALNHYLSPRHELRPPGTLWDLFGSSSGSTNFVSTQVNPLSGLSAWLERILFVPEDEASTLASVEVPSALTLIRDAFSLTTVQLSQVMLVSRQAIYDWTLGGSVKPENRQRIALLRDLACQWQELHPKPMGKIVSEEINGTTLLELLSSASLDAQATQAFCTLIAAKLDGVTVGRPSTARELAARHGMSPLSKLDHQRNLQHASLRFGRKG